MRDAIRGQRSRAENQSGHHTFQREIRMHHPVSIISWTSRFHNHFSAYRTHTATDRETLWVFDFPRLAIGDVAVAERAVHPKGIVGNDLRYL